VIEEKFPVLSKHIQKEKRIIFFGLGCNPRCTDLSRSHKQPPELFF